jgi:hypothetical protein
MKIKNIIIILSLALILFVDTNAQAKNELKRKVVRMGAITDMVLGIDVKDADAAFKIWTETFIKRLKAKNLYDFDFESKMYDDISLLKKDLLNNTINYCNVSIQDFFELNKQDEYIPFLSGTNSESEKFIHYLLISSNNKKDLIELSNKKIIISKSNAKNLAMYWIKSLLRDELGSTKFKSITFQSLNENDNEDLLAVFFGKSEYAVVSESTFNLACELNPSIKNKIKILRRSSPVVNGVFLHKKDSDPSTVKAIRDIAVDIHKDNEGRQILNLFKIYKIIKVTRDDLVECEKIITTYNKYFKK